jgi:hypothetical protein
MGTIDRAEGRRAFGADPEGYHATRPAYPERVFEILRQRCGLRPSCRTFEIGGGTGVCTQVAILRSDALALKVIEGMRLYQDPRFTTVKQGAPESPMGEPSMQPDPVQAAGLLGAFRGGLSVQPVPSTRLIQVSYTHSDPRFATEITNALDSGQVFPRKSGLSTANPPTLCQATPKSGWLNCILS